MKSMKKFASLALALALILSLSIPAFAAMEGELTGGSITITNPAANQKYDAYQIMYLESYNAESNAYAYKANTGWAEWLATQNKYVTIDDQGYITWEKMDDNGDPIGAAEFAALAAEQLAGKTADGTATAGNAGEDGKVAAVTISDLKLGYYIVDTTLGTLCSLDTTNPNVNMREKNEVPTSDKKVKEDSTGKFDTKNDADINQVVNFKSEVAVKPGAINYKFRDTMTDGLTLDTTSIKVTVNGTDVSTNCTIDTNTATPYTFTIAFGNDWLAAHVGNTIVITYSATLNNNAVAGEAEKNTADLEYGNKPEAERDTTPDTTTETFTWEVKVFKYTGENTPLADAKFKLYKMVEETKTYAKIDNSELTGWTAAEADGTILTSGDDGYINISGLDADTYYLTEIEAPAGYNKLSANVMFVIDIEGDVKATVDGEALADKTVKIQNNAGTELPSTGGIGTTIFYAVGGILVAAAVVLLVTKKRMASN